MGNPFSNTALISVFASCIRTVFPRKAHCSQMDIGKNISSWRHAMKSCDLPHLDSVLLFSGAVVLHEQVYSP
jgi:hypothetical protein